MTGLTVEVVHSFSLSLFSWGEEMTPVEAALLFVEVRQLVRVV